MYQAVPVSHVLIIAYHVTLFWLLTHCVILVEKVLFIVVLVKLVWSVLLVVLFVILKGFISVWVVLLGLRLLLLIVLLLVISVRIIVIPARVECVNNVGVGSDWPITRVLLNADFRVNNAQILMPPIAHHVSVGIHSTIKLVFLIWPATVTKHAHHVLWVTT